MCLALFDALPEAARRHLESLCRSLTNEDWVCVLEKRLHVWILQNTAGWRSRWQGLGGRGTTPVKKQHREFEAGEYRAVGIRSGAALGPA
jgi:hypothetical protein